MIDDTEHLAIGLIHAGMITLTEAADVFSIPHETLRRWCKQAGINPKVQRAAYVRKWTSIGVRHGWKLPRSYTAGVRKGRWKKRKPE